MSNALHNQTTPVDRARKPRVAFVGLGWIGLNRLKAIAAHDVIEIAALTDEHAPAIEAAREFAPAAIKATFDDLLKDSIEGMIIATPNSLHTAQTVAALKRGIAVFCQKPLGRNLPEAWQAINAARESDSLLNVDFSYRFIPGMQKVRDVVQSGALGKIFAVDLKFHNGYGPDKPWFFDREASGGGCVLDLGVHLIDLALWTLKFPRITEVSSALFAKGALLKKPCTEIEDYAVARMQTEAGAVLNLACSWNLHVGEDAQIEVCFYGTEGSAALRNVNGSFFEFIAEHRRGTTRETLDATGSDWQWGGLAAVDWCYRLAGGEKFDIETEGLLSSAAIIDRIYAT